MTNREAAFLHKVIEKQKKYLIYLEKTMEVTKQDIAEKEAKLEELRKALAKGES